MSTFGKECCSSCEMIAPSLDDSIDKIDKSLESDHSGSDSSTTTPKVKKSRISLPSLGFNFRRGRSLNFTSKRAKKSLLDEEYGLGASTSTLTGGGITKKSPKWQFKLNCVKKETKSPFLNEDEENCCKCTCYKRRLDGYALEENPVETNEASGIAAPPEEPDPNSVEERVNQAEARRAGDDEFDESLYGVAPIQPSLVVSARFMDLHCMRLIHEDCDEAARRARAREIEQGVDAPPDFRPIRSVQLLCSEIDTEDGQKPRRLQLVCPKDLSVDSLRALFHRNVTLKSCPIDSINGCHTQVDFIHCLVPDLSKITNCSFYWGKMDRYQAEKLLEGKPEGTFLLRDSAQEEFLFSVSFRKYGRSLHARIEQWNHKFSFDAHDPGVFSSDTVCDLIEHYKDPSSCMFFEPMLTWPLHRNFTFSLQHLCRGVITSRLKYDDVNHLELPKTLKLYLKEYHYRQKVRVKRFDDDVQCLELQNA